MRCRVTAEARGPFGLTAQHRSSWNQHLRGKEEVLRIGQEPGCGSRVESDQELPASKQDERSHLGCLAREAQEGSKRRRSGLKSGALQLRWHAVQGGAESP
jgi:hypothetical protein